MTVRRHPRLRRAAKGFLLLEIIVSMVILGVSLATLLRSFTLSMNAVRRNDITTRGCILAETLLQELEVNPPTDKRSSGDFEAAGFPDYSFETEFEEEELRYRSVKTGVKVDNLKPLKLVKVTVFYKGRTELERLVAAETYLYLPPIERWETNSKFMNELFRDEK